MSRSRRYASRAGALVVAAWLASIAPAAADTPPSGWDRARDPAAADRWALHVRVERLLNSANDDEGPLDPRRSTELRLEIARSLLEEADAARSSDPHLRFDLGIVYERLSTIGRTYDLHRKAIDVLAPALAEAPDADGSTEALESLFFAYSKLDRPKDEIASGRLYVARLPDERARVGPLMNLGEAQMRLGHLEEALATFRDVLQACPLLPGTSGVNATYALTLWDLAVALDRSGDPGQALATAKRAREWTWAQLVRVGATRSPSMVTGWDAIQDETNIFFVPDWEREWYLALGSAAGARSAAGLRESAHLWAEAEGHWDLYIRHAEAAPSGDRWVAIARVRRARVHEERMAVERRAAKLPPAPKADVTTWSDP